MTIPHDLLPFSKPLSRFLAAAGNSTDLTGAGPIIESAYFCTRVAAVRWPDSELPVWHHTAGEIIEGIRGISDSTVAGVLYSRPKTESMLTGILTTWTMGQTDPIVFPILNAILGRAWVVHGQQGQPIPDKFWLGLGAIRNVVHRGIKGTNGWALVAKADLTCVKAIQELATQIHPSSAEQDFLKCLDFVLVSDVTTFLDETSQVDEKAQNLTDQLNTVTPRPQEHDVKTEDKTAKVQGASNVLLDPRRVAARLSAADYSPALAKLGIDHRDHLLLDDLMSITGQLARVISHGTQLEQGFAAFHLICLLVSTSDIYTLSIQLTKHPDHVWLDIECGVWCWDFAAYRFAGKDRLQRPAEAEAMAIPLPERLAEFLKNYWIKDVHSSVESLICSIQGVDQFDLEAARKFLRQLGNSSHPIYRARWSHSLAPALLQITGSDMFSACASAQFASAAPASLFYFAPTYLSVYNRLDQVFERLELGPCCKPFKPSKTLGTTNIPNFEQITSGWTDLIAYCNSLQQRLNQAQGHTEVLSLSNELMDHLAAAFVVQAAHRCQRFDKLTYAAIACNSKMLVIEDKVILDEAARSHPRLVWKTKRLAAIINCAIKCREKSAVIFGPSDVGPDSPVFSNILESPESTICPVSPMRVSQIIAKFFNNAPENFGRSLWLTALDTCGVDRWLIRTLSGHVRDISRTSGPFFDVPPAHAASQIGRHMEEIGTMIFGDATLEFQTIEAFHFVYPKISSAYTISTLQAKLSPQLILEPIDSKTLTGATLATQVRKSLRTNAPADLSIHTNLLLHLLFLDLLDGEQVVFPAIQQPASHFTLDGPRPGLRWKRSHYIHDFWVPLTTESSLLCIQLEAKPVQIELIKRELHRFGINVFGIEFDGDVLSHLSSWARAYKRIYFPPSLLASSTKCVESPCLNQASLTRLWQGEVVDVDRSKIYVPERRKRTVLSDDVESLTRIINEYADKDKRHGERRRRAVKALADIEELADSWSPNGNFLREWAIDELERSRDNVNGRYELSSFSTYLSRLKIGFRTNHEDPYDWVDEDWKIFVETIERRYGNKNFIFGDSLTTGTQNALGALLRSMLRRSFVVSNELWAYINSHDDSSTPRDSASSTLLTAADLRSCEAVFKSAHENYPPNALRCLFRLAAGQIIPLRASDFANMKRSFMTPSGGFVIERSGFNSIKNQQSVRMWQLGPAEVELLRKLASSICEYVTSGDLLLRGSGRGTDNEEDLSSSVTFGLVLKFVTEDPKARPHSLRATTLQNLAWPQWQSLSCKFVNMKLSVEELTTWTSDRWNTWLGTARAAGAAGQSGISSALNNYLSGWPLVHALHASSLCADLPVSGTYVESLGLSFAAMRQAKSRANRLSAASFAHADWLQYQLRNRNKSVEQKSKTTVCPLIKKGRLSSTIQDFRPKQDHSIATDPKHLQYLVRRALGETSSEIQNSLVLNSKDCRSLERHALAESLVAECNRRARSGPEPRAISAQLRLLDSSVGGEITQWVFGLSKQQFECASYLFLWFISSGPSPSAWKVSDWQQLAGSLPSLFSLRLHRGKAHLNEEEAAFVPQRDLTIKPERDLGQRHRGTLHLRKEPDNRVQSARLTSILQLLLLCKFFLLQEETK